MVENMPWIIGSDLKAKYGPLFDAILLLIQEIYFKYLLELKNMCNLFHHHKINIQKI